MTTLYKTTKTGAIQQWSIEVNGPTYTCTFGQVDGKMQSQSTTATPKNLGRANATTAEQQAELEAQALIVKKQKSGYSTDKSAPTTVQLPMKVKSYQDQLHNIKFPCISTPKLDGVNAIYKRVDGKLTIYSRGGEVYPAIPHLEQHAHDIMDELQSNELNGELYIHGQHLQDIQSAVKKPKELSKQLTFNVFDISDSTEPYLNRNRQLRALYSTLESIDHVSLNHIGILTGVECYSHDDIEFHYNQSIQLGCEGTVIKNLNGLYKHNVRSSDQFKYKKAQSKEFKVTSYELDKRNHPVFILESAGGPFKAKPKGTHEFIESIDPDSYIGKWYTVEFETYSKSGIPLKPIGICLRDCDDLGNPLE